MASSVSVAKGVERVTFDKLSHLGGGIACVLLAVPALLGDSAAGRVVGVLVLALGLLLMLLPLVTGLAPRRRLKGVRVQAGRLKVYRPLRRVAIVPLSAIEAIVGTSGLDGEGHDVVTLRIKAGRVAFAVDPDSARVIAALRALPGFDEARFSRLLAHDATSRHFFPKRFELFARRQGPASVA